MYYSLEIMDRVLEGAEYMVETGCTIRELTEYINTLIQRQCSTESISKSTVHSYLTVLLPEVDWELYMKVRKVLNKNKKESSSRGGKAVHEKWRKMKQAR